jgi:threonine aldolase
VWPRQVNEVFAIIPRAADAALKGQGARYYEWPVRALPVAQRPAPDEVFVRLVTSFATDPTSVERFAQIVARTTKV